MQPTISPGAPFDTSSKQTQGASSMDPQVKSADRIPERGPQRIETTENQQKSAVTEAERSFQDSFIGMAKLENDGDKLSWLWKNLVEGLFTRISETNDLPQTLTVKNMRIFVPEDQQTPYKELVKVEMHRNETKSKLDFTGAVGRITENSPSEWLRIFAEKVLFICFSDPDVESPVSDGSGSGGTTHKRSPELRCPHFRNKCGIKRLV